MSKNCNGNCNSNICCDVKNCVYHTGENVCTADKINVECKTACSCKETSCSTFKLKDSAAGSV